MVRLVKILVGKLKVAVKEADLLLGVSTSEENLWTVRLSKSSHRFKLSKKSGDHPLLSFCFILKSIVNAKCA